MITDVKEYRERVGNKLKETLDEARMLVDTLTHALEALNNVHDVEDAERFYELYGEDLESFKHIELF